MVSLGCFHVLAIVNGAAVNIDVQVSFQIRIFIFSRYMPKESSSFILKQGIWTTKELSGTFEFWGLESSVNVEVLEILSHKIRNSGPKVPVLKYHGWYHACVALGKGGFS